MLENKKTRNNRFRLYWGLLFLCFIITSIHAQENKTFSGIVVDTNKDPIIGASVLILGETIGTITDIDGKFSLQVPEGKKVQISFVGYATKTITNLDQAIITLDEDVLLLEETVVVGYARQKKAHLTGAISTVNLEDIADLSTSGLGASLSGLVPGLSISGGDGRPGEQSRLKIRQSDVTSSFTNVSGFVPDNSPLYVIDGFISSETAFNNLESTMVESISVLKDAAAAVYGARSANGVILVTTKKGKIGKPSISYSGQFGIADEISRAKMLDSYNYGKLWNGIRATHNPSDTDTNTQRELFQADELEAMKNLNYNILDREWSAAFTQRHSINISGASERANYYAGISYYSQDGNLGKIDYNRWNYRAGVDLNISKWLKTSLQVSGDYGEQTKAYNKVGGSSSETDYNTLLTRPRYIPEYVNGLPIASFGPSNEQINDSQYYHFDQIQKSDNYTKSMPQNMVINSAIEYDFGWNKWLKGLKLKFTYSKGINTLKGNEYGTKYTLYKLIDRGGSGNHLYTGDDINLDSSNFETINVTNGNMLRRTTARSDNYQMNFILSYDRTFGDHSVSGLFTIEKSEREVEDLDGSVSDPYPFTNGQSNTATGTHTTVFGRSESGTLSYVGRANYAYMNKYLVEFLIRSDASTVFAPENYWGTFPSISAGWVMSEESWFHKNIKNVNYLKIRASFGLLGRDNTKAWAWLKNYSLNPDKGPIFGEGGMNTSTGPHIGVPDESINRDARWDQSYKSNFGLDLTLLKNRLGITFDGYYEWNRKMFVTRSGSDVPSTVGARPSAENYGSVDTWGVELALNWNDRIGKDFKYSIGINTGYSDNKVLRIPWESKIPIDGKFPNQRSDRGSWGLECIGMFRDYQQIEEYFDTYNITDYLGMTKEDVRPGMLIYKDIRGEQNEDGTYDGPDGKIDTRNDLVKISHRNNPYGLTINLKAEWKGLSIRAQIAGNWGGYDFVPTYARQVRSLTSTASGYNVMQFVNLPSFWKDNMYVYENVLDAQGNIVAEQNREAKYPNLRYSINGNQSTFWKVSATRFTLRNITLAYSIPKEILNKLNIGIESCRFNLTGQNLLSFYNPYPNNFIDPLSGSYGSYPNLRRFTLGVNVSF